MTSSQKVYLFLGVFLSTINLSKCGCEDYFALSEWDLNKSIALINATKSEDIVRCSLWNFCHSSGCTKGNPLCCIYEQCDYKTETNFEDNCSNESLGNVTMFHIRCIVAKERNKTNNVSQECGDYDQLINLYPKIFPKPEDERTTTTMKSTTSEETPRTTSQLYTTSIHTTSLLGVFPYKQNKDERTTTTMKSTTTEETPRTTSQLYTTSIHTTSLLGVFPYKQNKDERTTTTMKSTTTEETPRTTSQLYTTSIHTTSLLGVFPYKQNKDERTTTTMKSTTTEETPRTTSQLYTTSIHTTSLLGVFPYKQNKDERTTTTIKSTTTEETPRTTLQPYTTNNWTTSHPGGNHKSDPEKYNGEKETEQLKVMENLAFIIFLIVSVILNIILLINTYCYHRNKRGWSLQSAQNGIHEMTDNLTISETTSVNMNGTMANLDSNGAMHQRFTTPPSNFYPPHNPI
ncbi:uncharacterized protein LOC121649295 [Melanotaenia boesemani]|uniref:uncharacterized protein LOC121649295 n=1 Tax=Melanotaenia boesemani TaxID=1250792 RepID=UPI001C03A8AF|nr:uncharacterized protein LOC121649295 [Melanotaenia boesemani]